MDEEDVQIPEQYLGVLDEVIKRECREPYFIKVTSASSKGENFLGLLYRINVTENDQHRNVPKLNLILKIPPQSLLIREKFPLETIYTRETFVYNVLLPEFSKLQDASKLPESEKFHHVKCYRAESEKLKEMLVLEDLCAKGFKMADRRESLRFKNVKLVLKCLASFHAISFVLKKNEPEKFIEMANNTGGINDYNEEYKHFFYLSLERAITVLENPEHINRVRAYGVELSDKLAYYINPNTVGDYSVLCHGDCWNNNLLFQFKDEEPIDVMLLDWQISRNCSPVTDIAYLMFSSTDYDLRKEHFQDLMNFYHDSLAKSLSYMDCDIDDHYPRAVFEDHLKRILPYGLLMSFMLLPAVLGEAEDVPDMDAMLLKDKIDQSDLKFENKQSSNRYQVRMRGVVKTFIEMDLI